MPSVNRLYSELRTSGLEVLLVTFRESPDLVRRTARERGYVAPILLDASGEVTGKGYGVFGPPTAYLIDRRGQVAARLVGGRDWGSSAARRAVEGLLGEAP